MSLQNGLMAIGGSWNSLSFYRTLRDIRAAKQLALAVTILVLCSMAMICGHLHLSDHFRQAAFEASGIHRWLAFVHPDPNLHAKLQHLSARLRSFAEAPGKSWCKAISRQDICIDMYSFVWFEIPIVHLFPSPMLMTHSRCTSTLIKFSHLRLFILGRKQMKVAYKHWFSACYLLSSLLGLGEDHNLSLCQHCVDTSAKPGELFRFGLEDFNLSPSS